MALLVKACELNGWRVDYACKRDQPNGIDSNQQWSQWQQECATETRALTRTRSGCQCPLPAANVYKAPVQPHSSDVPRQWLSHVSAEHTGAQAQVQPDVSIMTGTWDNHVRMRKTCWLQSQDHYESSSCCLRPVHLLLSGKQRVLWIQLACDVHLTCLHNYSKHQNKKKNDGRFTGRLVGGSICTLPVCISKQGAAAVSSRLVNAHVSSCTRAFDNKSRLTWLCNRCETQHQSATVSQHIACSLQLPCIH